MLDTKALASAETLLDNPEIAALIEQVIRDEDFNAYNKLQDTIDKLPKEEPSQPKDWEYFSTPQEGNFEFYKEKAKFIFKNQLPYRDFLLEYRQNDNYNHVREIEQMPVDELRFMVDSIHFLDTIDDQIKPWYEYMFLLYTMKVPYKKLEIHFKKNKGSIENEVKKGIAAFAKLLMDRDINIVRGKEISHKVLQLAKVQFEPNSDAYHSLIGNLACKMHEMYSDLAKKKSL